MNSVLSAASSSQIAEDRHAEQHDADADDQRRLHEADHDVGHDLAEHDLDRRDRHRQQALHGAALDLARHRQRREDQHGHGEDGADQPRHDVELGHAGRVVARVLADFERRRPASGTARSCGSAVCSTWPSAPSAGAGGDRIGGVGGDQQRRPVAAAQRALEIRPGSRRRTAPCRRRAAGRTRLRCAAAAVTLK